MRKHSLNPKLLILVLISLSLVACSLSGLLSDANQDAEQTVEAKVLATLTAIAADSQVTLPAATLTPAQPTEMSTDTDQPPTGSISGKLGFPSEYIPPLRVVAFDVESQSYYYVDTLRNQAQYQITGLPPGTYHVVAYVRDEGPDMAGAYSVFVTCGQTVACTDHSLIAVEVFSGQETTGVDPIDFYAQPGEADWPDNPVP